MLIYSGNIPTPNNPSHALGDPRMAWILLLIKLLPVAMDIIQLILSLINKAPVKERPALRKELRTLARQNLRKKRNSDAYAVRTSEQTVLEELQALRDKCAAKAVA
jgi:hypothetical protein